MKVTLDTCFTTARRSLGKGGLSVRKQGGEVLLYEQPPPVQPNTPDQRAVSSAMAACGALWRALAPEQQAGWTSSARRIAAGFRYSHGGLTGYCLFIHCAHNCLLLGAAVPGRPPALPRPPIPRRVELQPAADPRTFGFGIYHQIAAGSCGAHRVVVSLTPATRRNCRAPETRNRRRINGAGSASVLVLPPSGGTITFAGSRFAIEPGRRFGVWVKIVRLPDGLASEELYVDAERK